MVVYHVALHRSRGADDGGDDADAVRCSRLSRVSRACERRIDIVTDDDDDDDDVSAHHASARGVILGDGTRGVARGDGARCRPAAHPRRSHDGADTRCGRARRRAIRTGRDVVLE